MKYKIVHEGRLRTVESLSVFEAMEIMASMAELNVSELLISASGTVYDRKLNYIGIIKVEY